MTGREDVRTTTLYTGLAAVAIALAATGAILSIVGLALARADAAGAAAICAVVFFVPGLAFLNHSRRLRARDAALLHVAGLVRDAGVVDADGIAEALDVPREDAARILRTAASEGHLRGRLDGGRFVAADAPRCGSCDEPVPRRAFGGPCPRCGRPTGG